jgi:DNA-binding response OmpR family regulator
MSSGSRGTGADFLVLKSDLAKTRKELPSYKDILIVEDENKDANRLIATLRGMFGYDLDVRRAKTLSVALEMVLKQPPELVLLDDYLGPSDTAADSIPMIRRAGFAGSIVVISGALDRDRKAALIARGATDTIHKDELNSVAIAAVLTRIGLSSVKGVDIADAGTAGIDPPVC